MLLLLLLMMMITDGFLFYCVLLFFFLFADSYGKYRLWHGVNREGELYRISHATLTLATEAALVVAKNYCKQNQITYETAQYRFLEKVPRLKCLKN